MHVYTYTYILHIYIYIYISSELSPTRLGEVQTSFPCQRGPVSTAKRGGVAEGRRGPSHPWAFKVLGAFSGRV